MKIGYPCINTGIGCTSGSTFRLKYYSEDHLKKTVSNNLNCLRKILEFNKTHHLMFFRICSGTVPFASHPINNFDWQEYFRDDWEAIGEYITENGFRISVHPDQFTLINSLSEEIFEKSKAELQYHTQLLDSLNLDNSAKIQIHVGGAYRDKAKSISTFVKRFRRLEEGIKRRLVIENDERIYNVDECISISNQTGIPVVLDVLHHKLNHGLDREEYLTLVSNTWDFKKDGVPMVDYSSQEPNGKVGRHAETLDVADFEAFLISTRTFDFDLMLEIKDKETSAIKALQIASSDPRIK